MKSFTDFFRSEGGIALISILWGLGLASLFKKSCVQPKCKVIEYRAPDADTVEKSIYYLESDRGTECYRYSPYAVKCSTN
jgi:hypothetical protein